MKLQFKKAVAATLVMSMCLPATVMAAAPVATGDSASNGSFETSFDVYSPTLHISVPLKADVRVNPMADATKTDVNKFTVASNSLDIINGSVDTTNNIPIPVNVTVSATITKQAEGVMTEYNTFTPDTTSTRKRINLNLTEAGTAAGLDLASRAASSVDAKLLDLSSVPVDTAADYSSGTNKTAVTLYGSLLSVDIGAPTATGTDFTNPTDLTPTVGSFAITGEANTNADWKKDDVEVAITYNIKASKALAITTPAIATASSGTGFAADVTFTVPNVGEATVLAIAIHNNGEKMYGDYMLEDCEIEYVANAGATDAEITIPQNHPTLVFLADEANGCKGKAQDLIIGLSDGRRVVSTLTVN